MPYPLVDQSHVLTVQFLSCLFVCFSRQRVSLRNPVVLGVTVFIFISSWVFLMKFFDLGHRRLGWDVL